jgi:hypothetical protein
MKLGLMCEETQNNLLYLLERETFVQNIKLRSPYYAMLWSLRGWAESWSVVRCTQ